MACGSGAGRPALDAALVASMFQDSMGLDGMYALPYAGICRVRGRAAGMQGKLLVMQAQVACHLPVN